MKLRSSKKLEDSLLTLMQLQTYVSNLLYYYYYYYSFIQKLLDTMNSYSKVAWHKIKLQKSIAFLYINNKQTEKEYMETIPFIIASKKNI
jgi:hypothetical protein